MLRRWGPRFLLYALFIAAVALAAALPHLSTAGIAVAMGATWVLVASLEWVVSRAIETASDAENEVEDPRRVRPARPFVAVPPVLPELPAIVVPPPEPEPEPVPEPAPEPALVEESGVPPEVPPEVRVPEPAPLEAVPEPEPVATPVPEPQQPPPAPSPVPVLPTARGTAREWNIWDLERLTRDAAGRDAFKDEERSYLLMYLREFANADGVLPPDFDGLVRDSFGDLVGV